MHWLEERRYRATWSDPHRSLLSLEAFAETEEDGGHDLELARERVTDQRLVDHLRRHAGDELRHARMFSERAAELAKAQGRRPGAKNEELGRAFDLSEQRDFAQNPLAPSPLARGDLAEVDGHGFFRSGLFDEHGEVGYLAMVHVAEKRAAHLFARHERAARAARDARTAAIFADILRDEKYHVAWTGKALDRWRSEGRAAEVDRALKDASRGRFIASWRRLGLRSASGFVRVLLVVSFATVLAPFGLLARLTARSGAEWSANGAPERLS